MAIEQSTLEALALANAAIDAEKAEVDALVSDFKASIATLEANIVDMRGQMGVLQEQVVVLEAQVAGVSVMNSAERAAINAQIEELALKASNINVATAAIADAAVVVVSSAEVLMPAKVPVVAETPAV
jgi:chromosome segregation ATPase